MKSLLIGALTAAALPGLAITDAGKPAYAKEPRSDWMNPDVAAARVREAGYPTCTT
jgi:hypothetical protein